MEMPQGGIVLVDLDQLKQIVSDVIESYADDCGLNLTEAAEIIGTTPNTLSADIKNGCTVPHKKVGRAYKFSERAVYKWLGNENVK